MITTTKDTFSFSRLLMVLRHDVEQDWKDLSFKTLAVLGLLAGGLLIGLFMGHPFGVYDMQVLNWFQSWFMFIFVVGSWVMASEVLKSFSSKTRAVNAMMLPATRSEKFLSRVVIATVGYIIMVLVALAATEVIFLALRPMFDIQGDSSMFVYVIRHTFVPEIHSKFVDDAGNLIDIEMTVVGAFCSITTTSWIFSVFALGSSLWRKHVFVKSLTMVFVISSLINFSIGWFIVASMKEDIYNVPNMLILMGIITGVLTIANWIVTYQLYKRRQIISMCPISKKR